MANEKKISKQNLNKVLIGYGNNYDLEAVKEVRFNAFMLTLCSFLLMYFLREHSLILIYFSSIVIIIGLQFQILQILINIKLERVNKSIDNVKDNTYLKTLIHISLVQFLILKLFLSGIIVSIIYINLTITFPSVYNLKYIKYFEWFVGLVGTTIFVTMYSNIIKKLLIKNKLYKLSKAKVIQKYIDYINIFHSRIRISHIYLIIVSICCFIILTANWLQDSFCILFITGVVAYTLYRYSINSMSKVVIIIDKSRHYIPNYDETVSNVNISLYSSAMAMVFLVYPMFLIELAQKKIVINEFFIISLVIGIFISLYQYFETYIINKTINDKHTANFKGVIMNQD
jgi:hypothetical protein